MRIRIADSPFWNVYILYLLIPGGAIWGLIWAINDFDGEHIALVLFFSLLSILLVTIAVISPIYFLVIYAPLSISIGKKKCCLRDKGRKLFTFNIDQIEVKWEEEDQTKFDKNVFVRALFYPEGYCNDLTIVSIQFESYRIDFKAAIFRSTFLLLRKKINKYRTKTQLNSTWFLFYIYPYYSDAKMEINEIISNECMIDCIFLIKNGLICPTDEIEIARDKNTFYTEFNHPIGSVESLSFQNNYVSLDSQNILK